MKKRGFTLIECLASLSLMLLISATLLFALKSSLNLSYREEKDSEELYKALEVITEFKRCIKNAEFISLNFANKGYDLRGDIKKIMYLELRGDNKPFSYIIEGKGDDKNLYKVYYNKYLSGGSVRYSVSAKNLFLENIDNIEVKEIMEGIHLKIRLNIKGSIRDFETFIGTGEDVIEK